MERFCESNEIARIYEVPYNSVSENSEGIEYNYSQSLYLSKRPQKEKYII